MTTLTLAKPRTRPLISWRMRKLLIGYSYLVPAALCMLATVVVPIILAIKMSLYADVLYKPQDYRFIGLGNYVRLVQDPVFWLTLWNSVVWVLARSSCNSCSDLQPPCCCSRPSGAALWCARSRCCPGSSPGSWSD